MTHGAVEEIASSVLCYHCGDRVGNRGVQFDDKSFCCSGCRSVYEILRAGDLCTYYALSSAPGSAPSDAPRGRFTFLDDQEIRRRMLDFSDGTTATVTLSIPSLHCSSCIWLLESLHKIDSGILHSRVDFLRKQVLIRFDEQRTSLRRIVELVADLGYEPELGLDEARERTKNADTTRSLYYKIGIAGFSFANIMLFSFPEYLSGGALGPELKRIFGLLNLGLALPVFAYSASDYFRSAVTGVRRRMLNIDVPIALGLMIVFLRSVVEILAETGPGYFDSMTGLVLFLLVGRVFQSKTYDGLNFERTYASYFPLAVTVRRNDTEQMTPVSRLAVGDRMVIRHGEIVPADAVLMEGIGRIDYAFVTGESAPVEVPAGKVVYAGGRQVGGVVEMEVVKEVSQGYLTHLWREFPSSGEREARWTTYANTVGKYFTYGVLLIALFVAAYWLPRDIGTALDAVTGVLIVACPCALALATPFAYGTAMRILGRHGLYLKRAGVVESLARVDTVVFDKTGTIAHAGSSRPVFVGAPLAPGELQSIVTLAAQSGHPLSRWLAVNLDAAPAGTALGFREHAGEGIEGQVGTHGVCLGSPAFVARMTGESCGDQGDPGASHVVVAVDGVVRGYFAIGNQYREGLAGLISRLRKRYELSLLSGDNDSERQRLRGIFGDQADLRFHQSPSDKVAAVQALQRLGKKVMMIGDGLNDGAALNRSDVGVAIAERPGAFSPAADAILDGGRLADLRAFLDFTRSVRVVVLAAFLISLIYNFAGFTFAARGVLSPLIAAILMPLSSITVVAWSTLLTRFMAHRKGLL